MANSTETSTAPTRGAYLVDVLRGDGQIRTVAFQADNDADLAAKTRRFGEHHKVTVVRASLAGQPVPGVGMAYPRRAELVQRNRNRLEAGARAQVLAGKCCWQTESGNRMGHIGYCDGWAVPGSLYCAGDNRRIGDESTSGDEARRGFRDYAWVAGGTVTTPEELAATLQLVVDEAGLDLDDAACAAHLADKEAAHTEQLVTSLTHLRLPAADVALVEALLEPARQRKEAAVQRQAAAEHCLALAKAALEMVGRHLQLQGAGAAGTFYGN